MQETDSPAAADHSTYETRYLDGWVPGRKDTRVDALIDELVAAAKQKRLGKRKIAELTKMHVNTLHHFGKDTFQPSLDTIRRLEKALLTPFMSREINQASA